MLTDVNTFSIDEHSNSVFMILSFLNYGLLRITLTFRFDAFPDNCVQWNISFLHFMCVKDGIIAEL